MVQRSEVEIKGVRVVNYPGDGPILARWAVEKVVHMIPDAVKSMVIVDYSKIGPEIFQPIKDWYHRKLEDGVNFDEDDY